MARLLLACALAAGAGCGVPAGRRPDPPPRWRVVGLGDRRVLLEREPPPRVEVRLSKERASPGEVVEAEVWLPGGSGRRRIEVRPSRPDITILGPREFDVEGAERVQVRFSGISAGRAGLLVLVRE